MGTPPVLGQYCHWHHLPDNRGRGAPNLQRVTIPRRGPSQSTVGLFGASGTRLAAAYVRSMLLLWECSPQHMIPPRLDLILAAGDRLWSPVLQ